MQVARVVYFVLFCVVSKTKAIPASIPCTGTAANYAASTFSVRCPPGCRTSTRLWGDGVYRGDSYICLAAMHDGKISGGGGIVTVSLGGGANYFQGTTKNGVTSQQSYGYYPRTFSFAARSVTCTTKGITLTQPKTELTCPPGCAQHSNYLWGSKLYTHDSYLCSAAIHDGRVTNAGGEIVVYRLPGLCHYSATARHGIQSSSRISASASFAFSDLKACFETGLDQSSNNFVIECPQNCQEVACKLWGSGVYTENSYICASAIHSGQLTGDGGRVTGYKVDGKNSYESTTRNGLTSKSFGNSAASFTFANLCLKRADSESQSVFTVACPPGCKSHVDRLWGTRLYTADSYVCAAAIHSGSITDAGGAVTVQKEPGASSYEGSLQNGITSSSYGAWSSSFVLRDSCTKRGDSQTGPTFDVFCPTGCSLVTDRLWGTEIFSADSYVCAAALHDGIIDNQGGRVTVYIVDGQPSYAGTTKNGITSRDFDAWDSSFVLFDPTACKETAEDKTDEGTASCPRGCQHFVLVWGTSVYTDDSYICAAAIHDGQITDRGGEVTFFIKPGQASYQGSERNGISTRSYGAWSRSFGFDNICRKTAEDFSENIFTVECPNVCQNSPHNVWGTKTYTSNSNVCAAALHDGTISSSGGSVRVYKSGPRFQYLGTTQNGVTSLSLGYYQNTFEFSDSCSVQGNNYVITPFELHCRSGCRDDNSWVWGTNVYTDASHVCTAAIHYGIITDEGGLLTVYKVGGLSSYEGSTHHGIESHSYGSTSEAIAFENLCHKTALQLTPNEDVTCPSGCLETSAPLYGSNYYSGDSSLCKAAIHDGVITDAGGNIVVGVVSGMDNYAGSTRNGVRSHDKGSFSTSFVLGDHCAKTGDSIHQSPSVFFCPPRCNANTYSVWGTKYYSSDSNICVAAIHSGIITSANGGKVTVYSTIGLDSYESSYQHGINSKSKGMSRKTFTFKNICQTTGTAVSNLGKHVIPCPSGCGNSGVVVGTDVYRDSSQICAAAIHNGRISNSGGLVTFYKASFMDRFLSSTQHGITSSTSNARSKTILFSDTCRKKGDGMIATTFTIMCVPGCDREDATVWGTGVYTDDSDICAAAIHAGKITASMGGLVSVQKGHGKASYPGSTRNGIESFTFAKWDRSMTFLD